MTDSLRVAVVQRPSVALDRSASMQRLLEAMDEASDEDAGLVVFPETYVPGYPDYIWRLRPGDARDYEVSSSIHARLVESAVDLESDDLAPVMDAARSHGMVVVLGLNERDGRFSRETLYNTVVTIGPDGSLLNRHRKLVPTNPERMVWAPGDATGLRVVETPMGRIGGLICWENYMPLARFALYAQGVQLYVAPTWDTGDTWAASMRHIAKEGRCWVLAAGFALQAKDIPEGFPDRHRLYPDPEEWINPGDSVVIDPQGQVIAGPMHKEYGLLTADIDVEAVTAAHYTLDAAGHYNRPDIFRLAVNRTARPQVEFDDLGPEGPHWSDGDHGPHFEPGGLWV